MRSVAAGGFVDGNFGMYGQTVVFDGMLPEFDITWSALLHREEEEVQRLISDGSRVILDPSEAEHRN